jgi:hypothetical protein
MWSQIFLAFFSAVAVLLAAVHELGHLGVHDLDLLLAHGLAEDVGLAHREPGQGRRRAA